MKSLVGEAPATDHPAGSPATSHPLREKLKDALVALSLANLCFISSWFTMLYDSDRGYFNKLPVTPITLLALVANLFWFASLTWLLIRRRRGSQHRTFNLLCDMLLVALLVLPLDFCRTKIFEIPDFQVLAFFRKPVIALSTLVMLAVLVWQHRRAARAATIALGIFSPLALFTLSKIVLVSLGLEHLAQHSSDPPLPPASSVRANQPRVVWMIFDETDQRLAFDQRPASLQLPEFDRLRHEAVYATNAFPPAANTISSMPALISGQRLSSVSIKNASDLNLTLADTGATTNWSALPSVFDSARALGINTALVGWYHPYIRVLGRGLNYCADFAHPGFEPARALAFGTSIERQIGCMAGTFHTRQLYVETCRASLAESLSLVTNRTYGLLLLHLPPPHKPGVYNPQTGQFTLLGMAKSTGYFNNLALADRWLGTLRRAMETSCEWDKTWVILSADHSWRESAMYDGRRDLRVPFLVKAPGSGQASTYSPQFNTVLTHDLILAVLRGDLTTQAGVVGWLDVHRSPQPTLVDSHRD